MAFHISSAEKDAILSLFSTILPKIVSSLVESGTFQTSPDISEHLRNSIIDAIGLSNEEINKHLAYQHFLDKLSDVLTESLVNDLENALFSSRHIKLQIGDIELQSELTQYFDFIHSLLVNNLLNKFETITRIFNEDYMYNLIQDYAISLSLLKQLTDHITTPYLKISVLDRFPKVTRYLGQEKWFLNWLHNLLTSNNQDLSIFINLLRDLSTTDYYTFENASYAFITASRLGALAERLRIFIDHQKQAYASMEASLSYHDELWLNEHEKTLSTQRTLDHQRPLGAGFLLKAGICSDVRDDVVLEALTNYIIRRTFCNLISHCLVSHNLLFHFQGDEEFSREIDCLVIFPSSVGLSAIAVEVSGSIRSADVNKSKHFLSMVKDHFNNQFSIKYYILVSLTHIQSNFQEAFSNEPRLLVVDLKDFPECLKKLLLQDILGDYFNGLLA